MSHSQSIFNRSWLLVLVVATVYLGWSQSVRIERVNYVTALAQEDHEKSNGSGRQLIVPEHLAGSYSWVTQAQQMLQKQTLQVRRVDEENAPLGREVRSASLYRYWLAAVAWVDRVVEGVPVVTAVERAAVLADSLLQALGLWLTTFLAARVFGNLAACANALGWIGLFPLGQGFLPGVPDDFSLTIILMALSVWLLLAGLRCSAATSDRVRRGWYAAAGVAGGAVIWLSVSVGVPLWVGTLWGAVVSFFFQRWQSKKQGLPSDPEGAWTAWGWGGALMILAGFVVDGAPDRLGGWELRSVHPIYAVSWLGSGYLLAFFSKLAQGTLGPWRIKVLGAGVAALAASALFVAMKVCKNQGFLAVDLLAYRLTKQGEGVMAPNWLSWVQRDEGLWPVMATVLPLLLAATGLALLFSRSVRWVDRRSLSFLVGPAAVALGMSWMFLRWWQLADVLALAVLGLVVSLDLRRGFRMAATGLVALILGVGVFQNHPRMNAEKKNALSVDEVEGLVERDLARWLTVQGSTTQPPVVLAPPSVTAALNYYGNVKGLGTLAWENKDGLSVALRMAISTSRDEALVLLRSRGVTHIVIPSWDPFFDSYTQAASLQSGELFWPGLKRWSLPSWLRPVPYPLPKIPGFEEQSVVVFEIVDEQSDPLALSRIAEYFVEMDQPDSAKNVGQALLKYPADFGALVTRAQLAVAIGDQEGFEKLFGQVLKRLGTGADKTLAWDRRVSLTTLLARGKRMDLAKVQAEKCLSLVDEKRLRGLTTYSLYHFQYVCKVAGLSFADPALKALGLDLLPKELSTKLR